METKPEIELSLLDKRQVRPSQEHYSSFRNFIEQNFKDRYIQIASKWRYFSFFDSLPLVKSINRSKSPLIPDELPPPYTEEFNIEANIFKLDSNWMQQLKKVPASLLWALKSTFRFNWNMLGFMTSFVCIMQLVATIFLGKVMGIISQQNLGKQVPFEEALAYAVAFALTYMVSQYSESFTWYFAYCINVCARYSITALMYKKLNCVALSALQQINIGKIINLMSNDLMDLDMNGHFPWSLFFSPFHLLIGFVLVWTDFSYLTFIALGLQAGLLWLTSYLSDRSKTSRAAKNQITDARIKLTNEMIEWARFMKLYAWEKPLRKIVNEFRDKEVEQYINLTRVEAIAKPLGEITVNLIIFLLMLSYVMTGGILSAEKVYFSMTVLNFMKRKVLIPSTNGRIFIANFRLMQKRIEDILTVQEIQAMKTIQSPIKRRSQSSEFIRISDLTARWDPKAQFCLRNINIAIPYGKITSIIGKIGSGKTSLLMAFLKEIPEQSGLIDFQGSVAYVEQDPIVFSQSVRDNILFGREYDEDLYKEVIRACCLEEDLKQLDYGDQTIVGERGVTLSGGQKARLSLARAIYSQSDIYLLDDPMAAVDSRVAKIIFEKTLKGHLGGKTVLLVTHHLSFAKQSDHLIVMDEGSLVCEGTFQEIQQQDISLLKYFPKQEEVNEFMRENDRKGSHADKYLDLDQEEQKIEEEKPAQCTWGTYFNYFKEGGQYCLGILTVFTYVSCSTLLLSFTRVIGIWADAHVQAYSALPAGETLDFNHWPYVIILFCLLVGIAISYNLKIILTAKLFLRTNTVLHNKMLHKVSRCQVSFLDKTPSGRIINRFSGDLAQLDRRLWAYVFDFLSAFFDWVVILGYLSLKTVYLMIPTLIIIIFFYTIKIYFTRPLIQMKNIELSTMSPLYSDINSTLHGLIIVRVYRQGVRFIKNFLTKLYINGKVVYQSARVSRLFALSLLFGVYVLVVSAFFLFIYMVYFSELDSGLFGMGLYNLIAIGLNSVWMIRQTLFIEQAMQSAERVLEYCKIPEEPEENKPLDADLDEETEKSWPDKGLIKFQNVYLKYSGATKYALAGVSFKILPGTKVGIVGRTGAGKSTILQALFRMTEINNIPGSVIEIDGTNIQQIGLEYLRKNICIIPQTPIIFNGSIKRNIDPFGEVNDEKIWEVLEEIKLRDYVDSLPEKLETEVSTTNSVFSAGQRQLICLGRVLLKRSKLLVLDEATANVDIETDEFIQKKIREKFPSSTILTIAHRLTTIADYDKVIVMEKGKIEEFDHPYLLLVKKKGDMKITKTDGLFAKLVKKNGEEVAQKIFELAKANFLEKNPIKPLVSKLIIEKPKITQKESFVRSNSFAPFFQQLDSR